MWNSFRSNSNSAFSARSTSAKSRRARARRSRLTCETLETRRVLTTVELAYEFTDLNDQPLTNLSVGDTAILNAYIRDVRPTGTGIFQAYFDITVDDSLISIPGDITNGPEYNSSPQGTVSSGGLLDEVGGQDSNQVQPIDGGEQFLLFSVQLQPIAAGTLALQTAEASTPATAVIMFDAVSGLQFSEIDIVGDMIQIVDGGISITPSDTTTTEAGGTVDLTIVLNEEPTATVDLGLSVDTAAEASLSQNTVQFTTANWDVPQIVTVTGLDDDVDDGDVSYQIITAPLTSSDPEFNGMDPDDITLTNQDNDTAGLNVSTNNLSTSETSVSDSFTVVLTSEPLADVQVDLTGDSTEGSFSESSLIFTSSNWNIPRTIDVTGIDDDVDDGDINYTLSLTSSSTDGDYDQLTHDINVVNVDNDTAEVLVQNAVGLVLNEDGTQDSTFTIRLGSEPTDPVTVDLVSSDLTEGQVSPLFLTFDTNNWDLPQTVTLTPVDDPLLDGDIDFVVGISLSSDDVLYDAMAVPDVNVRTLDNDSAGVNVTPTSGLVTGEDGTTDSFTVVLTSQPTDDVTLSVTSSNTDEGTVDVNQLVFTPANWDSPQTVTVTGVDDSLDDGDVSFEITLGDLVSDDSDYDTLDVSNVFVTNTNDDFAAVLISPTSGLQVGEDLSTAQFSVVLGSMPTDDVILQFTSSDTSEGDVTTNSLTFTPSDFDTPQLVVIQGVNDDQSDGDVNFTVSGVISTDDLDYSQLSVDDVSVTNLDNDIANVRVTTNGPIVTDEDGATATFTVVLDTEPTSAVSVDLNLGDPSEGMISASSLDFTTANWNTPQQVTITGVADMMVDGDVSYTISSTASSTDSAYDGLVGDNVNVTNTDVDTAEVIVKFLDLTTTEDGGTSTFSVHLSSIPTSPVTIDISSSDTTEGTVTAGNTVTLDAQNWETGVDVTVTGVDDSDNDGNQDYTVVLAAAQSLDTNFDGFDADDLVFTNNDNDVARAIVTNIELSVLESGGTDAFSVRLSMEPTDDVTFTFSVVDDTLATLSTNTLVFTPQNWDVDQTITVTGVDDDVVDGNTMTLVESAPAQSNDPAYAGIDVPSVTINNLDDDMAGVAITPSSATETTEAGGTATFDVMLTSQPTDDVFVSVTTTSDEGTVINDLLTFTPSDWNVAQTLEVQGNDDDVDDGDQAYTLDVATVSDDNNYDTLAVAGVSLTNINDDTAGFQIDVVTDMTTEAGGQSTFTVQLTSQPLDDVSFDISSSDTAEGTVDVDSLTFTAANWNVPQTVTVTGVDDEIDDDDVSFTILMSDSSSDDPLYDLQDVSDVTITNQDDDEAGFVATITSSEADTTEQGGTVTIQVTLATQPAGPVAFEVVSSDTTEVSVTGASVILTPLDWNTGAAVTLNGLDDLVNDGDQLVDINVMLASSDDPKYDGLSATLLDVTNQDNDTAGVIVAGISDPITTEDGDQATFQLVLNSQPVADVTIPIVSSNEAEGVVSADSLTFTSVNWNVPQTVIATGVDDLVDDGDVVFDIQFGPIVSDDSTYEALTIDNYTLTNQDNDTASVVIDPNSGLVTTESGGNAIFTAVLSTQPFEDVVVMFASNDVSEGVPDVDTLTFTPDNWDTPQTVTVEGVDDVDTDGQVAYTLSVTVTSDDAGYDGLQVDDIAAINEDDDIPGITVRPLNGLVTTEAGGTDTFEVVLNFPPTADVTIPILLDATNEVELQTDLLTFTPANWDQPQQITVTGLDDFVDDDDQPFSISFGAAASQDPGYDGLMEAETVVGINQDDDTAAVAVTSPADLRTDEAGSTSQDVSYVLLSQPVSDVILTVTVDSDTEATLSTDQLTFTPADWDQPQTVTVTGVDDDVDDDDQTFMISAFAVSDDTNYDQIDIESVNGINEDDDTGGVVVTAVDTETSEIGATGTINFVLTSQPTEDVTFALSTSDDTEGAALVQSVTFTPENWNVAQSVTVGGVNDDVDDGDIAYQIITSEVTSDDPVYDGLVVDDVDFTNEDDDESEIFYALTSRTISEDSTGLQFGIVLGSEPTADVIIPINIDHPDRLTFSVDSITFTPETWDMPQIFTYSPVVNDIDEPDVDVTVTFNPVSSDDALYEAVVVEDLVIALTDDDESGVATGLGSTATVSEDGTSNLTQMFMLTSQPAGPVTVTIGSSNENEVTVSQSELTFTPDNWNVAQEVTFTSVDDQIDDGPQTSDITISTASTDDPIYDALADTVIVFTNEDDDEAGFVFTPDGPLTVVEGNSVSVELALTSEPTADVTVPLLLSNHDSANVNVEMLTFTPQDWFTPQTIELTIPDDQIDELDEALIINFGTATSDDPNYSGLDVNDVDVTIQDDADQAGITIVSTSPEVTEDGATTTISVVLTSEPIAEVTIDFTSADAGQFQEQAAALSFTPLNWDVPQTFVVAAADDDIDEADVASNLVATATSIDSIYDGLSAETPITIVDNDTAEIIVSPTSGLTTEEGGAPTEFTVVLGSEPTSDVAITFTSTDTSEGTLANDTIVFTSANWDTPQTVSVQGVSDNEVDGPQDYRITGSVSSNDSLYSSLSVTEVALSTPDSDAANITLSLTNASVQEGDSGSTNIEFTVTLDNAVTGGFSVSYATAGDTASSGTDFVPNDGTVTFAGTAGETQTITIVVNGDADVELDETLNVTLGAVSGTALSNAITVDTTPVQATIENDDTATVAFAEATSDVIEADGTLAVSVVLSIADGGSLAEAVTVDIVDQGTGTANSPGDFTFQQTSVTFPAGSVDGAMQDVTLNIVVDQQLEDDETLNLGLEVNGTGVATDVNPTGQTAHTVNITDDPLSGIISGVVWTDSNSNNQRETNENGIPGVIVRLVGTDNRGQSVEIETLTDQGGAYSFNNLPGGTYEVTEEQPAAFYNGDASLGTVDGAASGNAESDRFDAIELTPGSEAVDYNFAELGLRAQYVGRYFFLASRDSISSLLRESSAVAEETEGTQVRADAIRRAAEYEIRQIGDELNVVGTSGDDLIRVIPASSPEASDSTQHTVELNSRRWLFPAADIATITVDAGLGTDELELHDSDQDDTLEAARDQVLLFNNDLRIEGIAMDLVRAISAAGGTDSSTETDNQYTVELEGDWQ